MIKLLNIFNNFSQRVLKSLVPDYTGMLRVKAGRPLINYFLKIVLLVKGSIDKSLVKVIVSYVRFLYSLQRKSGIPFTVKYLKASVSLTMQCLSGEKHKDTRVLGLAISRTRRGLPRFIPAIHRRFIRSGSLFHIRLWLTLMSFYRVLDYTGKLSIKTIITPSTAIFDKREVELAVNNLNIKKQMTIKPDFVKPFFIASSSPTSTPLRKEGDEIYAKPTYSSSLAGIVRALIAYSSDHSMIRRLQTYIQVSQQRGPLVHLFNHLINVDNFTVKNNYKDADRLPKTVWVDKIGFTQANIPLGKLAFKIEAAGKIRVFAMVDCFTQWVLRPLHKSLFSALKTLSSDATFDQTKAVEDFNAKITKAGISKVFSFDLTAATDRLPISVQKHILSYVTDNPDFGEAWAALLVDRWYHIPFPKWNPAASAARALGLDPNNLPSSVRTKVFPWKGRMVHFVTSIKYITGQPMGALSSWAMLALTHHVMVQIAANRAGLPPGSFHLYLVLGDDLVIAHEGVAKHYLKLAKEWEVEINLSKSVLSRNGSFEFAKRFFYKGSDVTGTSFKEMSVARFDIRGLFQMVQRISKVRNIKVSEILSFLGHGYKALSRINGKYARMGTGMRRALMLLSFPGMPFSTLESPSDWLSSIRFNKSHKVLWTRQTIGILRWDLSKIAPTPEFESQPKSSSELLKALSLLYPENLRSQVVTGACRTFGVPRYDLFYENIMSKLVAGIISMYLLMDEKNKNVASRLNEDYNSLINAESIIDTVWNKVESIEDLRSENIDQSDYRIIRDVQTLGSSVLLKKADTLRKTLSRFQKEQNRIKSKIR